MAWLARLWRSTLGKKVVMAATGLILFGFLVGHVAGNLLIFAGRERFDGYSAFLHESPLLLWGTRILLLAAVALHILVSVQLTLAKRAARPIAYEVKRDAGSTYAGRTMMLSGPIIGLFVIYHLLHFTTGTAHPEFQPGRVYENVVSAFRSWPVAAAYIVAMATLSFHLSHGIWSMFQTAGLNSPKYDPLIRGGAWVFTILVTAGFIAVPAAVLAGIVKP
jgi:succinate dehydrogenase / fumarate reductase cytochrome b subunit